MLRRILFGVFWFVVLYMGACILTGAVVGAMAGAGMRDPESARAAGEIAGAKAARALAMYFLTGTALLAFVGTWTGFLPGTRKRKRTAMARDADPSPNEFEST
jgi:hypothetical protein